MVFFNYALRKLNAKIVYYGPGLCGKTTNLVWIHDHFEGGERGKMISLATEGDRTIFFDLLPLEIGAIRGMDVTLQLYTVPGQVHYNSTRQLVLRGADGVVFVGDSQRAMLNSNADSFKNLQENLLLQGISLDGFPLVLQFNKRDLRDVVPMEELNDSLNHYSVPIFEAVATEGVGVQETLEGIVKLVMRSLRQRYEGATTGARTPGVADQQVKRTGVSVPEAPAKRREPTAVPPPATPAPKVPVAPPAAARPVAAAPPPQRPAPQPPVTPPPPPAKPPAATPPPVAPRSRPEYSPEDGAKTTDFSKTLGPELFSDVPAEGFADEISTAVYDLDADFDGHAAIDYEEFKKLDAPPSQPKPPPPPAIPATPPQPPAPPAAPIGGAFEDGRVSFDGVDVADISFDAEPTDVRMKAPEVDDFAASGVIGPEDADIFAPPDFDSIPDFELDDPNARPEPSVPEAYLPEPEPEPEFEIEVLSQEAVEEASPFAEIPDFDVSEPEVTFGDGTDPASPPPMTTAERYEDRIDAPSPFVPQRETAAFSDIIAEDTGELVAPLGSAADRWADEAVEAPAEAVDTDFFEEPPAVERSHAEAVLVGDDDPWTEEELSGVYDLAEVEKLEAAAAAIEPAARREVDVRAEDNQLHLRLQGTGAIIESGQVRALDIEVPVPGAWVGNRRVTLQLRLTLIPDTEDEDGGAGGSS
jgi:signal recognition particle receptor subunit beta